jgi:hypothetical protein
LCHDDGSIDESVDALMPQLQKAVAAGISPSSVETFHKLLPHEDDSIVFLGVLNLFRECCASFSRILNFNSFHMYQRDSSRTWKEMQYSGISAMDRARLLAALKALEKKSMEDFMHEVESLSDGFPYKQSWCALAYSSSSGYEDDARAALQSANEEFCRSGSYDPVALIARARLLNASDPTGHTQDGDALLWEFKESFPRISAWLLREGEGTFFTAPLIAAPKSRSLTRWEAIKTQCVAALAMFVTCVYAACSRLMFW